MKNLILIFTLAISLEHSFGQQNRQPSPTTEICIDEKIIAGDSGYIHIAIPSIAEDQQEITIAQIVMPLPSSNCLNSTSAEIEVYSQVTGNSNELERFHLINEENINPSVAHLSWFLDQEQNHTIPLLIADAPGNIMLAFSYTKIIPGHHVGWNWTWIPEKEVTTIIHVPIVIIPFFLIQNTDLELHNK
jgi:hypothetical protein